MCHAVSCYVVPCCAMCSVAACCTMCLIVMSSCDAQRGKAVHSALCCIMLAVFLTCRSKLSSYGMPKPICLRTLPATPMFSPHFLHIFFGFPLLLCVRGACEGTSASLFYGALRLFSWTRKANWRCAWAATRNIAGRRWLAGGWAALTIGRSLRA